LKLLIKLSLLHLVGCLFYYINDAPSYKQQNQLEILLFASVTSCNQISPEKANCK